LIVYYEEVPQAVEKPKRVRKKKPKDTE